MYISNQRAWGMSMKRKPFARFQQTYHIFKLKLRLQVIHTHRNYRSPFPPSPQGDVMVSMGKNNIWVLASNMSPLIRITMCLPFAEGFLLPCQNYIINYWTSVNIVFGTISLRNNLIGTLSIEGNFLSGCHPSVRPCLQCSISWNL